MVSTLNWTMILLIGNDMVIAIVPVYYMFSDSSLVLVILKLFPIPLYMYTVLPTILNRYV